MIDGLTPYTDRKDSGLPWLGEIPAHWDVRRNGRLFVQRNQTGFPDLPILEVSLKTGVRVRDFENSNRKQVMADREKYKRARQGDIAYNMMRMWQGAVGTSPVDGLVSPAYVVAKPLPDTESRYYQYLFRTGAYMDEVNKFSRGIVSDRNRLYWEDFKQMPSPFPPPEEQAAIVRFLDHADRRIRRYIRAKRQLIALLNEQKQAIIHRAVTRGLDPHVKLKPSGNSWFPDIPEHWDVLPMRRVIRSAIDGPHHSPKYVDEGVPFLSARNIKEDSWSLDDAKYISESDYHEFCKRVTPEAGDVLYTKGGTTGVARAVDLTFPFQVWVHVAVLKIDNGKVTPGFLAAALNTPRCYEQSQLFTRGATNQDLGLGRMKGIVLPVPPLLEQDSIVEFAQQKSLHLLSGIESATKEIELLREIRTRLIADVVTGKLDVREAAAALPDELEAVEPDAEELLDEDDTTDDVELDTEPEEVEA